MCKKKNRKQLVLNEAGFTLVEVLVALTIFAIVGVATLTLIRRGIAVRNLTRDKTQKLLEVRHAISRWTSDLASVQAFSFAPLTGSADSLSFTILGTALTGGKKPINVSYAVRRSQEGEFKSLIRTTSDFTSGRRNETLLSEITEMSLQYLQRTSAGYQWRAHWPDRERLPFAVQVRLQVSPSGEQMEIICPIRARDGKEDPNSEAPDA
ncbi:MAG: type II secretion system protein J [bacterium]